MDLSQYQLEALRRDEESVLYRGVHSNHSVLFLDEVGNSPRRYNRSLRGLEDQELERLGRGRTHKMDVRVQRQPIGAGEDASARAIS